MSKPSEEHLDKVRRNLLDAVVAALEVHEHLVPDHGKYETFLEDLVEQTDGYKVDRKKFEDFHNVLYFVLLGTFGVDGSDGKSSSNVKFHLTDRERYPGQWIIDIPYTHRIPDDDEKAWAEVMRLAALKARSAQDELSQITEIVGRNMARRAAQRARIRRSNGCYNEKCRQGLVRASYDERQAFERNRTEFQRRHMIDEPYPGGGYRILCPVCQTQERQDELNAEQAD